MDSAWEVDQYSSDQIMAQWGETMGARRRATCSHADCFAKWRGAVGRIMACSGHGGKTTGWHRPWFDRTLGLSEKNAYRSWPKECGYGGGRSWRGRKGQCGLEKRRELANGEDAGGDTVLAIEKTEEKEERDKQTSVLECGSTG